MSEVALEEEVQATHPPVESEAPAEGAEATPNEVEAEAEPVDPDNALQSFLTEQGLGDEAEDTSDGTKPESTDTPKALTNADIERIRVEERERLFAENRKQGARKAYEEFAPNFRREMVQANVDPRIVEWVAQKFTEYNGHVQQFATEEVTEGLRNNMSTTLRTAAAQYVPGIDKEELGGSEDFVSKLVEGARKGYVKQSEADKSRKAAVKEYQNFLKSKGLLPGSKEVPGGGTNSNGTSGRKPDDILDDPNATYEEKDKAFEAKHGFKPT